MGRKLQVKIRGNYKLATAWMRKQQVYTKQDVINFYIDELGKDYKAACGSALVLLSPRLKSKHGDVRGSASNPWGHLAYNAMLDRECNILTGEKAEQKYRFRFRETTLDKKRHTYYKLKKKSRQEKETTTRRTRTVAKKTARAEEVPS